MAESSMHNNTTNDSIFQLTTPCYTVQVNEVLVGLAIFAGGFPGFFCNIVVIYVLIAGGLLRSTASVIYRPMFSLLICDTVMIAIYIFFLTPAVIWKSLLIPDESLILVSKVFGAVNLWMWHLTWLMINIIAFGR